MAWIGRAWYLRGFQMTSSLKDSRIGGLAAVTPTEEPGDSPPRAEIVAQTMNEEDRKP